MSVSEQFAQQRTRSPGRSPVSLQACLSDRAGLSRYVLGYFPTASSMPLLSADRVPHRRTAPSETRSPELSVILGKCAGVSPLSQARARGGRRTVLPMSTRSEPADYRVHEINEQRGSQQHEEGHESDIQPRAAARPQFGGVDVESDLTEPDGRENHHPATQHDEQQAGDV